MLAVARRMLCQVDLVRDLSSGTGKRAPATSVRCQPGAMTNNHVDLEEKLSLSFEHWSPKVVARLNDYEIRVVTV
jgi:hypothetical protein